MFLQGDIDVTALINSNGGNLLTIDSHLTIYGSDDHLRKIANTIQDHLSRKKEKESDTNECTTYRKQAG
jgi:hypothetical protein